MKVDRLAISVDGGGTKSEAVLVDKNGNILGWGRTGSAHSLYVGSEAARQACLDAIQTALGDYRPRELWIAGLWKQALEEWDVEIPKIHFVRAYELSMGLAMALQTHGILVLSGTGAFVGGATEDGRTRVLDGLGPILGDYGSGYQIGLMGLRAAMASSWTAKRKTSLATIIPQTLGVENLDHIFSLVYTKHIGRSTIASVAKTVVRAADDGDKIARKILISAADSISVVLADVINSLSLRDSDYALVASGSIAQNSRIFWERVCERALEIAPNLKPICPSFRPCIGGALLALRDMGVQWTDDLIARIEETQKPFLKELERKSEERPKISADALNDVQLEYTPFGPRLKGKISDM